MTPKKKIPTKAELVQLQKLYKTDEKIGERLGGVPAYLIAYWRRKKNIPKYSLPKFSEREIRTLWERYGDDEKCGMELGISKAAFYNWRRRYSIKDKPAFLKLEQLELDFPGLRISPHSHSLYGEQSVVQKIISRASGRESVKINSSLEVEPDLVTDNVGSESVISEFLKISQGFVWNAGKIVISDTHVNIGGNGSQPVTEFVRRQGIKTVYDLREGHCTQVLLEKGHVRPGQLIIGTDKSVAAFGCIGAFALVVEPTLAAHIWSTGKFEMEVPVSISVELNGRRGRGVFARDIITEVLGKLEKQRCAGRVIEFNGMAVSQMSISERFTLCFLTQLLGAKGAICPYNSTVRRYLTGRTGTGFTPVLADKNAIYEQTFSLNINGILPSVYTANDPVKVKSVAQLEGENIRQIVLGCCANGRFDDLRVAADILKGNKVHNDCRLFICPASRSVYLEALKKGLIRVFVEAGAIVMNPGGDKLLAKDDSMLSKTEPTLTTSLDKMPGSEVFYCSPATAAASAIDAAIADPARFVKR